MAGLDYQSSGVWRYRLLAGFERLSFLASDLPTTTTPILKGQRHLDAERDHHGHRERVSADRGRDHSRRRQLHLYDDVLLQGRADSQLAQYAAGGIQTSLGLGGGAAWLLGPQLRLRLDYDYFRQSTVSGGGPAQFPTASAAVVTGHYSQSLVTLTLHVTL